MKSLNSQWLTEGLIDFEYKKYLLLAYFRDVRQYFSDKKLYPLFSDLIFHYKNLLRIKENKILLYESFPKKISRADFESLTLVYRRIVEDDELMKEISDIVEFALLNFRELLEEAKEIYEWVEDKIEIVPIGLSPLYEQEGYLFISEAKKKDTEVYRYEVALFEGPDENYRGVHTRFIDTFHRSVSTTYENIKLLLIRRFPELPNPATFLIHTKEIFPRSETLLPVAKRLLIKFINRA